MSSTITDDARVDRQNDDAACVNSDRILEEHDDIMIDDSQQDDERTSSTTITVDKLTRDLAEILLRLKHSRMSDRLPQWFRRNS